MRQGGVYVIHHYSDRTFADGAVRQGRQAGEQVHCPQQEQLGFVGHPGPQGQQGVADQPHRRAVEKAVRCRQDDGDHGGHDDAPQSHRQHGLDEGGHGGCRGVGDLQRVGRKADEAGDDKEGDGKQAAEDGGLCGAAGAAPDEQPETAAE
mgnify:CR=1 FL=1